ncbi:MAG TPA: DUF2867 domain-containing protein [Solirubrobacterales bacterium]|nr:DUF2867 domain-containing protein [Solirubrobacterales bacterium]
MRNNGRLPNSAHESGPWVIREIVPDFTLEDVWALPAEGGAEDFPTLLAWLDSFDPTKAESRAARFLWQLRDRLGDFGLGRIRVPEDGSVDPRPGKLPIPGTSETSLADRLPAHLRETAADVDFGSLPFIPLYRTDVEAAAEVSNQTMHGVAHLAWVEQDDGRYQGQMAVYVKPRGRFGQGYMTAIKPFRHWIVYPALMGQFERDWKRRQAPPTDTHPTAA